MNNKIFEKRKKVAEIIKSARIKKQLSQEQLAKLSNYSKSTINRIELCKFSPNADQLYKILEILDIEIKLNEIIL